MANNSKRQKKQLIGEDDMSTLLQRYKPTTVLTLLREVSEVEGVKIDWNAMVKKTSTGISNAREYQMLWRHLAYRETLLDRLDDASKPLDDDSDLECELDAVPAVTSEASVEATAYVKVLMVSGSSNDPNGSKVEGPLIMNIPKHQMLKAPANSNSNIYMQGTNIAVPVWVQKQRLASNTNVETQDSNGTANPNLSRRKQKQEDQQLVAAVQKYTEGIQPNILKEEFKGDRAASLLSQKRGRIRKRQGNLNVGNSSQLSEAQLATRHAVSMALDIRPKLNAAHSNLGLRAGIENARMASQSQSMLPSQHDAVSTSHLGALAVTKSRLATENPSAKPDISPDPDSTVEAAAVAAGARTAAPSDAVSLINTAQSNNAAYIMSGGSSLKPPIAGTGHSLPSNVHFIHTGLAAKPLSSYPTAPANSSQTVGAEVPGSSRKTSIPVPRPNSAFATSEFPSSGAKSQEASQSNPVAEID